MRFLWGPEFCVCVFFEDGPRSYDSIRFFIYLFLLSQDFGHRQICIEEIRVCVCVCKDDSDWTRFTEIKGRGGQLDSPL